MEQMTDMQISSGVSKAALKLLLGQGYKRAELAGFMGRSESFVSLVVNKKRNLSVPDLDKLEEATGVPIAILVAQSFKQNKSMPAYLKDFYAAAAKALKALEAEGSPRQAKRRGRPKSRSTEAVSA